jgi:PAP2 superfamily
MSVTLDVVAPERKEWHPTSPRAAKSWVRELFLVLAFYHVYQFARGSADLGARGRAFRHALWIVDAEQALHIYIEPAVQRVAVTWDWLITLTNGYYGSVHFIGTITVFVWLFVRHSDIYPRMRNLLGVTTGLGLICFWLFPLAPPRMFPCNDWVAPNGPQSNMGNCVVDTLNRGGSPWTYHSGVARAIANQFAAMPSLHFGWALWCAIVIFACSRSRALRSVAVFHVAFTLFAIMATANHYILDAVGGALVLLIAHWILEFVAHRRAMRAAPAEFVHESV